MIESGKQALHCGGGTISKNIVLLLIELAEHAEYATDFNISLKYYLDLFEQLGIGREIVLNEAGLLLINSSKVYARRVDYVQELVERQILTLTNADKEVETNSAAEKDENDTGIGESLIDLSNTNNSSNDLLVKQSVPICFEEEESFDLRSIILADERKSENDENEINLNKIRVYLPHLDDEVFTFRT
ncbi:unnamed protein product [Ceratitis capitata]|uniref:(Mediterranean fruit fly) hypothetical protein n=1 Tax=Ceratitis capitata TaxID=7213 RepID=A0A811U9E5_CERCA|nr:unnamed protein product [Ceratitis capitata]